jgi:NAD-reducing hydrogenase small subunit
MAKVRLATTWLDGCSGCHMSFLDIDEVLIDLAEKVELLFGPLVDCKVFPEHADVTLVEGAVSSEADRKNIVTIRERSGILVSFGDCAVTANVPGMRNRFPVNEVIKRAYGENAEPGLPGNGRGQAVKEGFSFQAVPPLCGKARPVHELVPVDVFLPGCPPPLGAILHLLTELLAGRTPDMSGWTRFGA